MKADGHSNHKWVCIPLQSQDCPFLQFSSKLVSMCSEMPMCPALHPVSKKFPQLQLSQLCKYCVSPVPTSTYQVAGCVRGLYFLYFIFHSIFSLQRAHSPSWPTLRMFLVRWLVSYLVFLKALEFLYFWARVLFALPFWELIVTVFKRKSTVNDWINLKETFNSFISAERVVKYRLRTKCLGTLDLTTFKKITRRKTLLVKSKVTVRNSWTVLKVILGHKYHQGH